MFLFDAVKMHVADLPGKIPSNVKRCYHAMRDYSFRESLPSRMANAPETIFYLSDPGQQFEVANVERRQVMAKLNAIEEKIHRTRSDDFTPKSWIYNWGNTGTMVADPKTSLLTRKFMGSHGAVGDVLGRRNIFRTMGGQANRCGFGCGATSSMSWTF